LQDFVLPQQNLWPIQLMGKFMQKTNMAKMQAILLDRSLGFKTHVLSLQPPLKTVPEARYSKGGPKPDMVGGESEERPIPPSDGDGNPSGEFWPPSRDALTTALCFLS
jgi:hypothetical protein